jgi:stearoyl-CoA desaturase (delta-9 desaturase)
MIESNFKLIRAIYYINVLTSLIFLYTNTITYENILAVLCIFFFMNPLGIAISYHRYWSHRSFEWRNSFCKYICTIPPIISSVGSILGWVGMHRRHHILSDVDGDPHKASKGFWNMMLMRSYDYHPRGKEVIDLMRDPFIVFSHQYYFLFPLVYVILLFILFGLSGAIIGYCMPAALSLITQNLTNFVNHYGDEYSPKNIAWINILNFGDGWHANHHNNPKSYTTKEKWWQLDPAGWMIKNIFAK